MFKEIVIKMCIAIFFLFVGGSCLFIGGMIFFAVPEANKLLLFGLFSIGLLVTIPCAVYIYKMNKAYLELAVAKVLANPEAILMQWEEDGKRVILTENEVVVNTQYYPFSTYKRLKDINLIVDGDKQQIKFDFKAGKHYGPSLFVDVPDAYLEEAKKKVLFLKNQY